MIRNARWPLLLLALLAGMGTAWAQETPQTRIVTIVNADDVAGETVDGQRIRRLIGNVHLRQDDTDLRSARATQYLDRDLIYFEGNVEIADATDTLRAASVSYDSRRRIGRARGNVRLADAEAMLYSDSLIFFRGEKRAEFEAPVRLIERAGGGVLTSDRGTYFTDRKEAFFRENVRLEDSTSVLTSALGRYGTEDKRADFSGDVRLLHERSTRMRSDSLTHFRDTRISEARGNVAILRYGGRDEDVSVEPDTTQRTILFGGFAFHDEDARYSRVERGGQSFDPLVARLQTDTLGVTDTLLIRARLFEALQPDSLETGAVPAGGSIQRILAHGSVQMVGDRLAAAADSAVVDRLEFERNPGATTLDDMRLFKNPIAWMNSRGSQVFTQVTGDTVRVTARDEAIDSLRAVGRAFAVRPDSVLARENQIRGRQMLALFRNDSLRAIRVWTAAEAIFYRADDQDRLEGASQVSADSLSFTFQGEDIDRITGARGIEGAYYGAEIIPSPFGLDGPAYAPESRPSKEALLAGRPPIADPFSLPPSLPDDQPPDGPPLIDEVDLPPWPEDEDPHEADVPSLHPLENDNEVEADGVPPAGEVEGSPAGPEPSGIDGSTGAESDS